jgi:hypothetical protein
MVERSSGTLPTRVQILVLTLFLRFSRIYRRYALSGKRCSRRRRGAIGDFGNLWICRCLVLRRCSDHQHRLRHLTPQRSPGGDPRFSRRLPPPRNPDGYGRLRERFRPHHVPRCSLPPTASRQEGGGEGERLGVVAARHRRRTPPRSEPRAPSSEDDENTRVVLLIPLLRWWEVSCPAATEPLLRVGKICRPSRVSSAEKGRGAGEVRLPVRPLQRGGQGDRACLCDRRGRSRGGAPDRRWGGGAPAGAPSSPDADPAVPELRRRRCFCPPPRHRWLDPTCGSRRGGRRPVHPCPARGERGGRMGDGEVGGRQAEQTRSGERGRKRKGEGGRRVTGGPHRWELGWRSDYKGR